MSLGIGIDIISTHTVQNSLQNSGEVFLRKAFTDWEISRAKEDPAPVAYYSKLFSAKEAIFKLFETEKGSGVLLTEIEIRDGKFGEPVPHLTGKIRRIMNARGGRNILLNISCENDFAVAVAILE